MLDKLALVIGYGVILYVVGSFVYRLLFSGEESRITIKNPIAKPDSVVSEVPWTHIMVCPKTGDRLLEEEIYDSAGNICRHCGDAGMCLVHGKKVVGKSLRIDGVRKFYTKEEVNQLKLLNREGV